MCVCTFMCMYLKYVRMFALYVFFTFLACFSLRGKCNVDVLLNISSET